jgi:ketosteroid isomerase-like protein
MGPYHSGRIRRMVRIDPAAIGRRAVILFLLLTVTSLIAQAPDAGLPPSIELPPEFDRVLREYEAAWSRRDAPALARLFTEDGYVMANGGVPVKGRPAIEKHYTGAGGPLFLRAFAYAAEGSVGYILGGFTPQQGGADAGKFTLTLRKGSDGRWLIASDMDSANRRPQR